MSEPDSSVRPDAPGNRRAIIDIGSNTVRLVVYGPPERAPNVLFNEKVTARLGKGVAENGRLGGKATGQALAVLGRFSALLRLHGIDDVQTVATAAVRDASNGAQFLERVAALGLHPRMLSGEEEAVISARGVMAAFPGAAGVVGDLGGGSLELVDIARDRCTHGISLPLGTLRLPGLRALGPAKFTRRIQKMLAKADWAGAHGQRLYLVGGSWRALARYAMLRHDWPVDDTHGFEMPAAEAFQLTRSLSAMRLAARVPGGKRAGLAGGSGKALMLHPLAEGMRVSASRLASLPHAAALLGVLVRELKPARLVFSAWGLREGLLASTFTPELAAQHPLFGSIAAFATQQDPGVAEDAARVLAWTAQVNPAASLAGLGTAASLAGESLRHAAIMLALASIQTEPNLRAELAASWALRKRWIGITDEARAMLALAVLANSGRTGIPADLLRLASPARLREALVWGLASRLCRRFTALSGAAMAGSALLVERGGLVLMVRADIAPLVSDGTVKDLRLLAEALGLGSEVRVLPAGALLP